MTNFDTNEFKLLIQIVKQQLLKLLSTILLIVFWGFIFFIKKIFPHATKFSHFLLFYVPEWDFGDQVGHIKSLIIYNTLVNKIKPIKMKLT